MVPPNDDVRLKILTTNHLKRRPILPKRALVGLGAASPPARVSTWNFGAMTVSRRRSCGCRGVSSPNTPAVGVSGDCEAE